MTYHQVEKLGADAQQGILGVQTLLVAAMVLAAEWVAAPHKRRKLSLGERGAAVLCWIPWVMPLTLGGDLSLYRA